MIKVNKERNITKPLPILPIRKARYSFISLPKKPPSIEGELKKAKNKEIHTTASSPNENPVLIGNKILPKIKDKPQLKKSNGRMNDEMPNQWYKN